jgi:hypothetical protein
VKKSRLKGRKRERERKRKRYKKSERKEADSTSESVMSLFSRAVKLPRYLFSTLAQAITAVSRDTNKPFIERVHRIG